MCDPKWRPNVPGISDRRLGYFREFEEFMHVLHCVLVGLLGFLLLLMRGTTTDIEYSLLI